MAKNIVICLDGTGNEFGETNSNVVKLFQLLPRDQTQAAFYDPGVGTMGAPEVISKTMKKITWVMGLAFGFGLKRNVSEAYGFLMDQYEPGDRVFLFGFSRGAYTARTLAAMLHKVGLLERDMDNQVAYAFRVFRHPTNFATAARYKQTFCRPCPVHFVGVWDTVSTVGWVYNPVSFPFTAKNPSVTVFRHAISVDEQRSHFRQNLFNPESGQDCKQVWFPGVHADVGGGYTECESGLAKISLRWMVREAVAHGLKVDQTKHDDIVLGEGSHDFAAPDAGAMQHNELRRWGWRLIEHLPRRYIDMTGDSPTVTWRWSPVTGFYRPRTIHDGAVVHETVLERRQKVPGYEPRNLPPKYTTEM